MSAWPKVTLTPKVKSIQINRYGKRMRVIDKLTDAQKHGGIGSTIDFRQKPVVTQTLLPLTPDTRISVYLVKMPAFRWTNAVVVIPVIPADSVSTLSDDFGEQRCPQKALSFSGMSLRI